MDADITILFSSGFYKILDFKCKCKGICISKPEYSKSFNISFIRKGNFNYKVFRNDFDSFTGYAIMDKPHSEHIVEHNHHIPDECTIIDFSNDFYQSVIEEHTIEYKTFFSNQDIQSLLIKTDSKVEYLHYMLLNTINSRNPDKIYIDCLVMDILHWFLDRIDNKNSQTRIAPNLKKQHLQTIEKAKDYIFNNFFEDINLQDIASFCNTSQFHFSRIFKKITNETPYQFLLNTRLTNAKKLISEINTPVNEACFQSGFQSIEHFNAAFKNKFHHPPSFYKKSKNS